MNDYRTLLAETYADGDGLVAGGCECGDCGRAIADAILATRIPWLKGKPTIAKALAIGTVMLEANGGVSRFTDPEFMPAHDVEVINSMLAYIITVDPSRLAAFRTEAEQ